MHSIYSYTCPITLAIALATPAKSASLSFIPTGFQLDSDQILEIPVQVGDQIDLSFFLDTTGLNSNLQSIDIRVDQDIAESSLTALRTDGDIAAFPTLTFGGSPQNGLFSALFQRSGDPGLAPNSTIELVTGTLDILPGLNNDGITDLAVTVTSAFDANGLDVTNLFQPATQSLELQQQTVPESNSIISLLTLGFLGVGSVTWKKIVIPQN